MTLELQGVSIRLKRRIPHQRFPPRPPLAASSPWPPIPSQEPPVAMAPWRSQLSPADWPPLAAPAARPADAASTATQPCLAAELPRHPPVGPRKRVPSARVPSRAVPVVAGPNQEPPAVLAPGLSAGLNHVNGQRFHHLAQLHHSHLVSTLASSSSAGALKSLSYTKSNDRCESGCE